MTGRRFTPSSIIMFAASVTGRLGPIVSAGADIASPTVFAASLRSSTAGGAASSRSTGPACRRVPHLLEEDVPLREHAEDVALGVDDRQSGDPVLGEQRGGLLQRRRRRTVSTSVVIRSLILMISLLGQAQRAERVRAPSAPCEQMGVKRGCVPTGRSEDRLGAGEVENHARVVRRYLGDADVVDLGERDRERDVDAGSGRGRSAGSPSVAGAQRADVGRARLPAGARRSSDDRLSWVHCRRSAHGTDIGADAEPPAEMPQAIQRGRGWPPERRAGMLRRERSTASGRCPAPFDALSL